MKPKVEVFYNPSKRHWNHTLCMANKNYSDAMNFFCKNRSAAFIKPSVYINFGSEVIAEDAVNH